MSKLTNQWIDVFAAGKHRESEDAFTEGDLDQIVTNYDPSHHEAPAVIGHPETNGPAYAWVSAVRRAGHLLQVQLKQAVPAFEEAVEAGRYKKRSVSLYKNAKGWALRHVGFLGAQPPEVKGLADIKFEQEDEESIQIEYQEEDMSQENNDALAESVLAKIKGWFAANPVAPAAGAKVYDEEAVKQLIAAAVTTAVAPLQADIEKQKTSFSETQTVAEAAATKSRADLAISGLKTSGRWIPAFDQMGLPIVFSELAKVETTSDYGEGDKKKSLTPLQVFVSYMETLPKIVPTIREVNADPAKPGTARTYSESADQNSIKLSDLAEARAKADNITFAEAGRIVAREHPELLAPGTASAGTV